VLSVKRIWRPKPDQRGRNKEWCDDKEIAKPVTTRPTQAGRARGKWWGHARSGLAAATTTSLSLALSLAAENKRRAIRYVLGTCRDWGR
jgi:hypothetical protein